MADLSRILIEAVILFLYYYVTGKKRAQEARRPWLEKNEENDTLIFKCAKN